MNSFLHTMPDAALFLVLCRMISTHMHSERPALFLFLAAWFAHSLVMIAANQAWPASSPEYARFYFCSTAAVWMLAAPALWQAGGRLFRFPWLCCFAVFFFLLGALLLRKTLAVTGGNLVATVFGASCWMALCAGVIFLLASIGAYAPDLALWSGAGAYFLCFGAGFLALRTATSSPAAPTFILFCVTAIWLLLAWQIGPRPDALFNLEKLGIIFPARGLLAVKTLRRPL